MKKLNYRKTPNLPELEEQVLKFWEKNQIFEKSVENRDPDNQFVFYDGPPFATGLPHYGHILASTTKDVVPRYQTMKGKRVERVWGWDCHGLPIENLIEKELDLDNKKQLEKYGIEKFNQACENRVLRYREQWKKVIKRMGRFVDMDNDYKTMDCDYMESVWWVFKQLYDRNLIYRGHKSMHICPRCATPLSNFEVTLGYKEIKDISIIANFEVHTKSLNNNKKLNSIVKNKKLKILAWTTTPWTLPGNLLLAVNKDFDYIIFKQKNKQDLFVCAKQRKDFVSDEIEIIKTIKGNDLVGLKYKPLFPYFADTENAFKIVDADFVTLDEGTGIVHIAPGFGEDDYKLGLRENIDLLLHVNSEGEFIEEVKDFAGLAVKPKKNHLETDIKILKFLQKQDKVFAKINVKHSYPHCWRCDTPLINYATESWFVKVTQIKKQLIKNNKQIHWIPEHIKEGRFGKWLENVRDWAISRNRYWGTPLPVWMSQDGDVIVVGSVAELEDLVGQKVPNLHKHLIDELVIEKNGKKYYKIPEVLDCWFESGSMPYGQAHYPFDNKKKFEDTFPAAFISEGQDQTRGWFYTLHVLATALTYGKNKAIPIQKSSPAYKNVICSGIILAEDGKKMSKRLKNYPEPSSIWNKYGVDSLRLYLMSSPVLKAESINFSEKDVSDLRRRVFLIWWNVFAFYKLYADQKVNVTKLPQKIDNIMDQWIVSRLENLKKEVTKNFDSYDIVQASRLLIDFIPDLSNWYLRLSRDRIKADNNKQVSQILGYVLYQIILLFAPLTPFFTEVLFQNIIENKLSVHLMDWPESDETKIDKKLENHMQIVKNIVEIAHKKRREKHVKVRQPLSKITVSLDDKLSNLKQYEKLLQTELNIKKVVWKKAKQFKVKLDFELTPDLKQEGEARDLIRKIQNKRKKMKLDINAQIKVKLPDWPCDWQQEIEQKTNSKLIKSDKFELIV